MDQFWHTQLWNYHHSAITLPVFWVHVCNTSLSLSLPLGNNWPAFCHYQLAYILDNFIKWSHVICTFFYPLSAWLLEIYSYYCLYLFLFIESFVYPFPTLGIWGCFSAGTNKAAYEHLFTSCLWTYGFFCFFWVNI